MATKYKALVIEEHSNNGGTTTFEPNIQEKTIEDVKENNVLIKVKYSSLNYKDALSATGNKGITRTYPHTPGIDAAGIVVKSEASAFKEGDEVICTGYDLGMNTDGGFAEYINVPASWLVQRPNNISLRTAMNIGTAGFTAINAISEITNYGIKPDDGNILVTGATGGVGIMAVRLLAKLGYNVVAASGKASMHDMLTQAGAKQIIPREELTNLPAKALLKQQYAAVIDTVGGNILANAIKSTAMYGLVATCGNIVSTELNVSIFPFILRGVRLIGLASAEMPMNRKLKIWNYINEHFADIDLAFLTKEIKLENVMDELHLMLQGKQFGRVVVNIDN